jgi:hypothetical protein
METQPLFLDHELHFDGEEKHAGTLTRLGDNVDEWSQEITQEAYKQLPYLSDFEVNVILDKVDEQKGFAYGSIEVRPKSAMSLEEQSKSPLTKMHVPIVVKDNMLHPLDIFLTDKGFGHLTEGRLRSALFRPEEFDVPRTRPYDPSLVHDLYPPIRAGYGGFGSGGVKTGAAAELEFLPLLPRLQGQIRQDHVDRLKTACQDPSVRAQISNGDEGVRAAFESALTLEPSDRTKVASVVKDSIRPNVVQIKALLDGNFLVKRANTDMFLPQEETVPLDVANDLAGEEDVSAMMEGDGTLTASSDAPVKETMDSEEVKVADSFGLYKVQDVNGNVLIGWVFPSLLSMDMEPMPLSLFTNGSQHALQEGVAGIMAGKSTDLPKGVPQGYGMLYYIDHGTAKAFVPMTINSSMRGPDGTLKFVATDDMGNHLTFYFSDAMRIVAKVGPSDYCVPSQVNWMPLRGSTELVSNPMAFSKTAAVKHRAHQGRAELVGDKDVFSWRGPAVAKLASTQTKFLDRANAEFIGVALGVSPGFIKEALSRASRGKVVSFQDLKVITPFTEKMAEAKAAVEKDLADMPVPIHNYFLAKEASVLDDALTADKILGLGFLNCENISTFIEMIPQLESTSSKIAEMLLASRLGMKDVSEVALERMLKALDDVIYGLKSLRHREEEKMQ